MKLQLDNALPKSRMMISDDIVLYILWRIVKDCSSGKTSIILSLSLHVAETSKQEKTWKNNNILPCSEPPQWWHTGHSGCDKLFLIILLDFKHKPRVVVYPTSLLWMFCKNTFCNIPEKSSQCKTHSELWN